MGQQIHIGGLRSSMDLAEKAGIRPGALGRRSLLLHGRGHRFLVRFRNVARCMASMPRRPWSSADADAARRRAADRIRFALGDACATGLPGQSADFVWGEDAWCYVVDKKRLVAKAVRLVKPGGTVAFTDWVRAGRLSRRRVGAIPDVHEVPQRPSLDEYADLLADQGCEVLAAEDTGRFAPYVDLYLNMLNMQLTYDALRIIGFDMPLMESLGREMSFMQDLAHAGKIAQGQFVARKKR